MKINNPETQRSVAAQARMLMSERRHKAQSREQSMLQRAAASVGLDK